MYYIICIVLKIKIWGVEISRLFFSFFFVIFKYLQLRVGLIWAPRGMPLYNTTTACLSMLNVATTINGESLLTQNRMLLTVDVAYCIPLISLDAMNITWNEYASIFYKYISSGTHERDPWHCLSGFAYTTHFSLSDAGALVYSYYN